MLGQSTATRTIGSIPLRLLALVLIGVVAAGGVATLVRARTTAPSAPTYQTAKAARGNVDVVVAATGPVSTAQSIPLTFKQSGKIASILVKPGDKVQAGQVLAQEDATDLQNTVNQATATLHQQQAALAKLQTGPTPQQVAVSQQAVAAAESNLANAEKNVQLVAAQNAKDLQSAQVALANAQQSLADAGANYSSVANEQAKGLDADRQAIANAQTALGNAQKNYSSVQAQIAASTQADQVAVQNAQQVLTNAKQNLTNVSQQVQAALQADATAVQNAQQNLANVQATQASGTPVQQQQLAQAKNDLYAAQVSRDAACDMSNPKNTQTGCNAANATVNTKETAIDTINAQIQQSQAQAQQTLSTAQQALKTAQDAANSDKVKQQANSQAAQQSVDQAADGLKTAQAALANDLAKFQGNVVQAQTSLDSSNGALKSAQMAYASDQAKDGSQLQSAQQGIDTATASVKTAQTALDGEATKAASALQAAQASVDADAQAVKTAQANLAQLQAPPTAADLDTAKAQVENAQAALDTAQDNLKAATLTAPLDATVAQVNGSVGQWLTGGPIGASSTSTSSNGFILLNKLSALQVIAQVNEADMAKISLGEPVDFTIDAFPGQTFTGEVAVIQPLGTIQQNIVNYNVTSTINPTSTNLLPGMTANVNIITQQRKNVLVVPSAALSYARTQLQRQAASGTPVAGAFGQARTQVTATATGSRPGAASRVGGATTNGAPRFNPAANGSGEANGGASRAPVLVLENGKAVLKIIEVGLNDGRNAEVISGLNAGDVVITGTGVTTRGARPAGSPGIRLGGGAGGGAFVRGG